MKFSGWIGTGSGSSEVLLALDEKRARVKLTSAWMGQEPFAVELTGDCKMIGSQLGAIFIESAGELPLPPSDGPIVLEFLRVPPQPSENPATDLIDTQSEPFTLLLWLNPHSFFDDGTELPADEYEVPPEKFRPVVEALKLLDHPWKLAGE